MIWRYGSGNDSVLFCLLMPCLEYFFDNTECLIIQANNAREQIKQIKLSRQALFCNFRDS